MLGMKGSSSSSTAPSIAIIGAGFSGIGMALRLKEAGLESFTIYEAASDVGGTWFHNAYPGAACDIASHLYSFSFRRKHDWTKTYAGHEEIRAYLQACMREQNLYPRTRLSTPIASAAYSDAKGTWTLTTAAGEQHEHDIVIFGCGQLNEPKRPDVPGLAEGQDATLAVRPEKLHISRERPDRAEVAQTLTPAQPLSLPPPSAGSPAVDAARKSGVRARSRAQSGRRL